MRKYRTWSRENDVHFGPYILWSKSSSSTIELSLNSAGEESEGAHLIMRAFGRILIIELPDFILRPHREKVVANWDAETVARLGRNWYWKIERRVFGFYSFEGHFNVMYGLRTDDSLTEKRWSCFLPWTEWRLVRHSLYTPDGEKLCDLPVEDRFNQARARRQTALFLIEDYDGEKITAACSIRELEWRAGTGFFKFLAWFKKPRISRAINIEFDSEVGPEKDSWKGGIVGTGADVRPGETALEAFKRFCEQEHKSKYRTFKIKFISELEGTPCEN